MLKNYSNMKKIAIYLICFFFAACSGSSQLNENDQQSAGSKDPASEETFDYLQLKDSFVVDPPDLTPYNKIKTQELMLLEQESINTDTGFVDSTVNIPGYRIQVFSSTSYTRAQEVYTTAVVKIVEDYVYLSYDQPFYKIRLGNFTYREDAEEFMDELIVDFPDAWIVRTQVLPFLVPLNRIFNDSLILLDSLNLDSISIKIDSSGVVIDTNRTFWKLPK